MLDNKFKIGAVVIQGKTALAPLAGVTDISFRMMCKSMGASIVFSEMVSADGIVRGSKKTLRYLDFLEEERPVALQIFGSNPAIMGEAARIIEDAYAPDIIDINFGCPVKKVVRNDAGSALLKDPVRVGKITEAVANAVRIPVTAKIRCGWDEKSLIVKQIGKILENAGAAAVTIHARTRSQLFSGAVRWEDIRTIKESVSVPVIGNGDVRSPLDAKRMLDETGCDMVMVGRGAMGNPWIFRDIEHFLKSGQFPEPPDFVEKITLCLEQLSASERIYGERYASNTMKKHTGWYLKGMPGSVSIKEQVFHARSTLLMKEALTQYRSDLEKYADSMKITAGLQSQCKHR